MRYLCMGDVHLDAGANYLPEGQRLADQRDVLAQIDVLARQYGVNEILNAGDVFEHRRPTPWAMRAWLDFVERSPAPVLSIAGNHDVTSADKVTAAELLGVCLRRPMRARASGTLAVLPWTPMAGMVAQLGRSAETFDQAGEALLATARDLREKGATMLMLHWSVSGSALPNGLPVDELAEPIIDLAGLEELGFDYVVCGHIHKPQLMNGPEAGVLQGGRGSIFYVGSPMPLNFGEAGVEHGVWILDTDDETVEFLPLASRPFVTIDDEHAAADVEHAIVRVRDFCGDEDALLRQLEKDGAAAVWQIVPQVEEREARVPVHVAQDLGPLDAVGLYCDQEDFDKPTREQLLAETRRYLHERD